LNVEIEMSILHLAELKVEYAQSGQGPDLLLVHSLLTEMTVFDRILPALEKAYRVTRVNLPGFGASSPAVLVGLEAQADHLARIIGALNLPVTTTVFGNGFGAFVGLQLAIRHGSLFDRLIVADCVPAFPEAGRVPFRAMAVKVSESGMPAILDTAIGRMFPPDFQEANPQIIADRKTKLGAVDAACFAQACQALAAMDMTDALGSIQNQTLVMCGALDQTTPPALARQVAQGIRGARYEEIPGSGHCPMLEQSEALVASIQTFLNEKS